MSIRTRTAALLLFGSGFCALLYQTTWLREFRLIFGASTAASAAVLGVFMAGLGFGSIFLGRYSESHSKPLALYGKLELLIAISAALSPLTISAGRYAYIALGGTATMGMTFGTLMRLVLTATVVGLPTFLMGGTLPAVARAVVTRTDTARRSLGILYGVNTLGAVSGALAGTFYLFENFGNHLSLWWAAVLNTAVALIALRVARSSPAMNTAALNQSDAETEESVAQTNPKFICAAAAIVGFAFFLMEMVWYRMLAPLMGGSTFTFGLILAIALLGIGLGGVTYALFELRRTASLQFFALTCAAEALFIAAPYALGDRIAVTAMLLRPLGTLGFGGHVIAWSALCSIVILPAAFVSGLQFPLLIALLGSGRRRVASQTGAAYAWNTIGALIGSLAGGFGFMPLFSATGVWKMTVIILAALAVVAACMYSRLQNRWLRALVPLGTACLALTMLTAMGPTAFWRHSQIGIGGLREYHASANELDDVITGIRRRTLWQIDGLESSVAIANADGLSFIVNGKSDGNAKADSGTQVMAGMIGATLHPNPEKALVIGLGTGSTAGWLAAVPSMQRVDVVELERSILKVAESCAAVNHHALENPKLHVTIGDGRELLLTSRQKYDLIVSEPSNPYRAGIASLFTREFYQSVERRLQPGGIFLQWVQAYDVDDRTIGIFYRTLGSVFGVIESWQTQEGDLLLMASRQPVSYDIASLRARLNQDPFRSALIAAWQGRSAEDFLAHYIGDPSVAKALASLQPWPLNTDDRTVIEFALARSLSTANGFRLGSLRNGAHAVQCDRPNVAHGELDWERVKEAKLSFFPTLRLGDQSENPHSEQLTTRADAMAAFRSEDFSRAKQLWYSQSEKPITLPELNMLAQALANEGDNAAIPYIDELQKWQPSDAVGIRAQLSFHQNNKAQATDQLIEFFQMAQEDPWTDRALISRSLNRAETMAKSDQSKKMAERFYEVLKTPFSVWNAETERLIKLLSIGRYLDGNSAGKYSADIIEAMEPNLFWTRSFLELRNNAYRAVHYTKSAEATRDLTQFVNNEAFTADTAALAKVLKSETAGAIGYATEKPPKRTEH